MSDDLSIEETAADGLGIEIVDEGRADGGGAPSVPLSEPGVPLHRFLDRAKLSLSESATLAARLLEAVQSMHETGCGYGRLDSRSALILPDGTVRLGRWRTDPSFPVGLDDEVRSADITAAAAIVAEIDKAAGRPVRPLTEREERLGTRLTTAADPRSLSRRGLGRAARGLELAVGRSDQREAARAGLAGLVEALAGYGHATADAGPDRSPARSQTPPPRKLPPPARRRRRWPRLWKPVAVLAAIVLVLGLEVHFFGDAVKRNVDTLLMSEDAEPSAREPGLPDPLPELGPPAAGPITHVELRPLGACRPEAVCPALLQVAVMPADGPLEVGWELELIDRCGSLRRPGPGGVLSVPPGKDRAVQTIEVPLPAGRSLAVLPVTNSPARVGGIPMLLAPAGRAC